MTDFSGLVVELDERIATVERLARSDLAGARVAAHETYERALEAIGDGCEYPDEIARLALRVKTIRMHRWGTW